MKKTLIALAVLGSVAGVAQAQSAVTVYGLIDAGIVKTTAKPTSLTEGNNSRIGFKGVEDLGGGLAATFQAEIRFEPDTGIVESGKDGAAVVARPLFQGQSRVGLKGDFGQVRLGRGLTAMQESLTAFDPWSGVRNRGTFITPGVMTADYNSDPLAGLASSGNRFSNALFYNTPVISGFQGNLTVATKEDIASLTNGVAGTSKVIPVSVSGTYNNGPIGAMLSYERNAIEDKYWQVAGSYNVGPANLMASYGQTKFGTTGLSTSPADSKTKGWLIGAKVVAGPGNVLVGYGQKKPDNAVTTKQASIGYEYNLSKRTFLYTDAKNVRKTGVDTINTFDVGISHNF